MKIITLLTLISLSFCLSAQTNGTVFDDYYFDLDVHYPTYKEFEQLVNKFNIKKISIWDCKDSTCLVKEEYCVMMYDRKHRILEETYFEDDKPVPFEKYQYPSNKLIIKKYNADNLFWVKYKMTLNDIGKVITTDISGGHVNTKINYTYADSLLVKEEIINKNPDNPFDGEGTTLFFYDKYGKIQKKENTLTGQIERFTYDSILHLVQYEKNNGNPNWENEIIIYTYSNGLLVQKITEWYNSGRKNEINRVETSYTYNEKEQLISEKIKNVIEAKTTLRTYSYDISGRLKQAQWIYPNENSKNKYQFYTYECY